MQTASQASGKTKLIVIILVIVVVAVVIAGATAFLLGPTFSVMKKNFTPYSTPVSQSSSSPSSVTVVDTNGGISITPWTQSYVTINGTVTARGIGANPDIITFIRSNSSGEIVFQAIFPSGSSFFFTTSYTVDVNVYIPSSYQFNTVQATTANGDVHASSVSASTISLTTTNGRVSASAITTTSSLTLTATNGGIDFTCNSCNAVVATTTNGAVVANLTSLLGGGSYTITSANGNIDIKLPLAATNFKITASTTNGSVSSTGLSVQLQNHVTATFGSGNAVVVATTTNGSITVTAV